MLNFRGVTYSFSWCLNQPIKKTCSSKCSISQGIRLNIQKLFDPTTQSYTLSVVLLRSDTTTVSSLTAIAVDANLDMSFERTHETSQHDVLWPVIMFGTYLNVCTYMSIKKNTYSIVYMYIYVYVYMLPCLQNVNVIKYIGIYNTSFRYMHVSIKSMKTYSSILHQKMLVGWAYSNDFRFSIETMLKQAGVALLPPHRHACPGIFTAEDWWNERRKTYDASGKWGVPKIVVAQYGWWK